MTVSLVHGKMHAQKLKQYRRSTRVKKSGLAPLQKKPRDRDIIETILNNVMVKPLDENGRDAGFGNWITVDSPDNLFKTQAQTQKTQNLILL